MTPLTESLSNSWGWILIYVPPLKFKSDDDGVFRYEKENVVNVISSGP